MSTRREIKNGVILSYMLIIVNMIYGLLITPFILKYVGTVDYGVYKSVCSLSGSLAVLDLGLGSTMTRYMSKYHAENDIKGANNFVAMIFIQYAVIVALISIVGISICKSLRGIYAETFTDDALLLAQRLFLFLIVNMILRLFENLLTGLAGGFEHFTFTNGVRLVSILLKILLLIILLPLTKSVMLIVVLESIITVCAIAILLIYIIGRVGIIPKLIQWDNSLFKESFGYTSLMFLQTLTIQFNGNVDNVLIGAKIGASSVTIYSISLQIYGMYESLSGSIANIMLPTMAKKIVRNETPEQLQKGVEKCGRMQLLVLGAALGGFIVLGKEFLNLWLGEGYQDCYFLTLILIIPVTFTMIQNVSLSILRARNKMLYRTVTLLVSCLLNVIVTIVGLEHWGYWGAAIGTAMATISNLVFMNIYYYIVLQFKIVSFFANVIKRILLCAIVATVVTYCIHFVINGSWTSFVINGLVYMGVYTLLLLIWGLDKEEKELVLGRLVVRRSSK